MIISFDVDLVFEYILAPLIVIGIIGGVATWKNRNKCDNRIEAKVDKIGERTLRHSHAFELMSRQTDSQTNRLHPGEDSNIAEQVTAALKDDKGNF